MKNHTVNPSVSIVIPIYQAALSDAEKASLDQCMQVLGHYPINIVKPRSLDLTKIKAAYPSVNFVSFDDAYFTGTAGYNKLLISLDFYKTFLAYEYILIYQLDAYVFKDDLVAWCNAGYDYIGAPSLHDPQYDALPASSQGKFAEALGSNRIVLNGGLSLRKIPALIRYLKIYNFFYPAWLGNEDMLFSQEATRLIPMKLFLRTPKWQEALRFSFEKSPAASFEITDHELPFACHAWERYDPAFWTPYILSKE